MQVITVTLTFWSGQNVLINARAELHYEESVLKM